MVDLDQRSHKNNNIAWLNQLAPFIYLRVGGRNTDSSFMAYLPIYLDTDS